jgi:hypothetical protein
MGTNRITGVGEPSGAQDAATKAYVDTLATGINAHEAVSYASTANITGTYANGTAGVGATLTGTGSIVIDGYTVVAGDAGTNIQGGTGLRLLLKDQTNTDQNGIYTVTACVSTTSWTLTRAYDYDALGEVAAGDFTYVLLGTANTKFTFVETSKPAAISGVGTAGNAITFGIFANGNLSGIVTGTQGGTGINNGSKTITISGNVTIGSSTDTVQFTTAGATNVTLPTTGTLLTSATAVTAGFTKKAASTVALTANTQATINHALGTQAVIVQMYETTSSLPTNLVDMDVVAFDTNNVKVTSQTSGTYYYVIIG